ncbi:hypothetical protein [Sphingomonas jatrophae]|uniref:Uncharacterized protein n=1 Tax=Sphingomonas jatrophae TaxID=1166337 RepID=A0A1I6L0R0_9SPHN|nr:hypothetical protein [Sphingomonas jatrophae]SFR97036.1 hypothetical protein SAMN05192580_2111 [Sphingomonas jatrophae]
MSDRGKNGLAGFGLVALLAALLAVPCYLVTQSMSVSGADNQQLGISGAIFAGIAVIAALAGGATLWFGRRRGTGDTRIALAAVVFTSLLLTLVAVALSDTRPTPITPPSADI